MMEGVSRFFVVSAATLGFLGVAAGAFGAHALKARLSPEMLAVFEVGVRYQMYHALALLAVSLAGSRLPGVTAIQSCFLAGVLIFSGSLYLLVATGVKTWGAVTPLGGLTLLGGWALLLFAALKI